MLLHISTDRIIFIDGDKREVLPYGELEKNLPDFLYSHLPAKAGPDLGSGIVVVNGPGSFTNIRIATLALNTYNTLHNFSLDFVSVSKIEWYQTEIRNKKKEIRRYCVMYIGQKKNFWVVDLQRCALGTREQGLGTSNGVEKVHVDELKEYISRLGDDWFVDEMVAEGKEMMDVVFGEGEYKMYTYRDQGVGSRDKVKLLEANYMIEANIS